MEKQTAASPETLERDERIVPNWLRVLMAFTGGFLVALTLSALIRPDIFVTIWPWTLSPLTARIMASWHAFWGVGALVLSSDIRWSVWLVPMQSFAIWYGLLLLALFWHQEELGAADLLNWYSAFVVFGFAGLLIVTLFMRTQPRIP